MLSRRLIAAAFVFAVTTGSAFAAEPSSSPRKHTPPSTIAGKSLAQWIDNLHATRDAGQRETAIRVIPYFEEDAKSGAAMLCAALRDSLDVPCRVQACLSLSYIAQHLNEDQTDKTVKLLIDKAEHDSQTIVRLHAVLALAAFGTKAQEATAVLGRRVHDPISWELRQAALYSLASVAANKKFGPEKEAVMPVARLLNPAEGGAPERSSLVRLAAVMTLRDLGVPRNPLAFNSAVEALEKATHDHDKSVAIWAHVTLIIYGKGTDERLNTVSGNLTGTDVPAKLTAIMALAAALDSMKDSDAVKKRLPEIIKQLDDKEPIVQATAIEALTGFGKAAADATPRLKEIMEKKDQNEYFRRACQKALKDITGKEPELPKADLKANNPAPAGANRPPEEIEGKKVEEWIKEIKDHTDPSVQETAIRVVPFFGEKAARRAVPALVSRLTAQNIDIACRAHAILALGALAEDIPSEDATEAVKAIANTVSRSDQAILRYHAATALGSFGPKAVEAIPTLLNLMHEGNSWEARQAAVLSLSNIAAGTDKMGPDPRVVHAISERILGQQESSAQVRMAMVMSLGVLGRPRPAEFTQAVRALTLASQDSNKAVSIWALVAWMAIDKVTDELLAKVTKHLKGKDIPAKVTAAHALGAMGKEARSKVGDIADLLKDNDPLVMATALEVLAGLGTNAASATGKIKEFGDKVDQAHGDLPKDQRQYLKDAADWTIKQIEGAPKK